MQDKFCPYCLRRVQTDICPFCGNDVNYPGNPMQLPVGNVLDGQHPYVLGAALGQGGFGITYIALDTVSDNRVAVKEYFPTHCSGRNTDTTVQSYQGQEETFVKGKEQFLEEARTLQSLSDLQGVVNIADFFEANNTAYLVMEFLDGCSLKQYVEQIGRIPAQQFLHQLKPLLMDMEAMHRRGVVHRDIAPDNIMLLPDGSMKLIDFGAARSYLGDKSMTVMVKKGFAPVEQYLRKGSKPCTDVYALAATIYYCVTGIVPQDSAERQYGDEELRLPTACGAELTTQQEQALMRALEIQPKDRMQTISELMNALEQISQPVQLMSSPKQEQVTALQADSKKKTKWWLPVAAALTLCIGAGALFLGNDQPTAPEQEEIVQISTPETIPAATISSDVLKYNEAVDLFLNGKYGKAAIAFHNLGDFRDAKTISRQIWDALTPDKIIGAGNFHTVAVTNNGTVLSAGSRGAVSSAANGHVNQWKDIVSVTAGDRHTVGLKNDGTVVATGLNTSGQCDVSDWTDIVDIVAAESFTAGLKSDGTVVYTGSIPNAEVIGKWENIVSISGERFTLAALRADGCALFSNQNNLITRNIIGLAVMSNGDSIIMQEDGNICLQNGGTFKGDYVSVFAGGHIILALQRDGTVLQEGALDDYASLEEWDELKRTDIAAFDVSYSHAVILKKDGTVSTYGEDKEGRCRVSSWKDIRLPKDRDALLSQIHLEHITDEYSATLPMLETQPR